MKDKRQGEGENDDETTRRQFLQLGASVVAGGSLASCAPEGLKSIAVNDKQKSFKRTTPSRVVLEKTTYEELLPVLEKYWQELKPEIKGKKIFLKINLVYWKPDRPLCTDPRFIDAVLTLLSKNGAAEIKIGDGPALSRDTERLVEKSGIAAVLKKHQIQFVDLNIDDLTEVENRLKFTKEDAFALPKSITNSDFVISLPKLKTHHWALMTASMKNLFGCLPGRKYGWPKNVLHTNGIDESILDLVGCIQPHFAIVDGVEAMEGDGPLNGTGLDYGALIMGDDVVAVDRLCANCMKLPVVNIPYLVAAGKCIGNADFGQIEVLGKSPSSMQRQFQLPPTYYPDGRPRDLKTLMTSSNGGLT
ncbi:MAG: DUF362 domain-containing protein [Candidatus Obscuribacterales bacterium]|jgi:uncharacterized protein (DUF362 family)|nr:DUF362 domain-containing protein [Candidatus Obscuribacterales bacterium]